MTPALRRSGGERRSGGLDVSSSGAVRRRNTSSRRLAAGAEVGQGEVVLGQPAGERGDQRRRAGAVDPVLAGRHLDHRDRRARSTARPCRARVGRRSGSRGATSPARTSAGVPCATERPRSMITTRSASRSASSRSWVVSSTAAPPRGQVADHLAHQLPAGHVDARGGLVEERPPRAAPRAPAPATAAAARRPTAGATSGGPVGQPDPLEQRARAPRGRRSRPRRGARPRRRGCRGRRRPPGA